MKLSRFVLGALSPLFVNSVAASLNHDSTAPLLASQESPRTLGRVRNYEYSGDKFALTLEQSDIDRLCDDTTNVTITAPQGNVTFNEGYLNAKNSVPPTIWLLTRDENQNGDFQVKVLDPAERQIYWQGTSGRASLGDSNYYRYKIKMLPHSKAVFHSPYGCLYFAENGEGSFASNTACTIVQIQDVGEAPEWEDQSEKSDEC